MKPTRLQFGVRENTASSRQHASRLEGPSLLSQSETSCRRALHQTQSSALVYRAAEARDSLGDKPLTAATGVSHGDYSDASAALGMFSTANHLTHAFEPLIGCAEAAKLLGNIHVKTLQGYARKGALPGYRVAGHWYFRASELDSWLRCRINSSCHPCRSNEEAK
jgi:excisionase family DNA binding protein